MAILSLLENCLNVSHHVFTSFFFPNPYCLTKLFPFPSPTTAALKSSSSSSNLLFPSRGIRSSRCCFPSCSVSAQLQIDRSSIFLDAVLPSLSWFSSRPFSLFFFSVCCPLNHFVVLTPSHMSVPPQSAFLHLISHLHHTNIPSLLSIHHPILPGDNSCHL